MTNKEKIEYLKRNTVCLKEVDRLEDEKVRLSSIRDKITPTYSDMPKSGIGDKTDTAAAIIDLDLEIDYQIKKWMQYGNEIRQVIESVPDYNLRLLLNYRYITGMKFEQIAVTMGYSWRQIHRLHGKALEQIRI